MDDRRIERRSHRPWAGTEAPRRILIVRYHAIGDVIATLPVAGALRTAFPDAHLAFLTTPTCADLARAVSPIDEVRTVVYGGRLERLGAAVGAGLAARGRFDVVIDLQRHRESRVIRRLSGATAWSEFDRFSPRPAFERVVESVRAAFPDLVVPARIPLREDVRERAARLLADAGWRGEPLVVLNPGGLFPTRNWPLERYAELARRWPHDARFLLVGDGRIAARATWLRERLGSAAIDVVGKTSLPEALAVVQRASVVITEDGGLLHMAWASGVPVVALLGGTRSDWTRPVGPHARWVSSDDLPCGNCMRSTCITGDTRCLSRVSADAVGALALAAIRGES